MLYYRVTRLSLLLYDTNKVLRHLKATISYPVPEVEVLASLVILQGDLESKDIVELMRRTFQFVANYEGEIPGAAPRDCGNYLLHDLPMAKWESRKFLTEVLDNITEANLLYPEKE